VPQDTPDSFSIDYSLGQVTGEVVIDTVHMGQPNTTFPQQAFGLVNNATADFTNDTCDGVFVSVPVHTPCASMHAARVS
jgi:hypothetical protein